MRHIENIEMDKVDFNYMQPDDISFFLHCIGYDSSYLTAMRPLYDRHIQGTINIINMKNHQ